MPKWLVTVELNADDRTEAWQNVEDLVIDYFDPEARVISCSLEPVQEKEENVSDERKPSEFVEQIFVDFRRLEGVVGSDCAYGIIETLIENGMYYSREVEKTTSIQYSDC